MLSITQMSANRGIFLLLTEGVISVNIVINITSIKWRGVLRDKKDNELSWLLFFYSLPSQPTKNRMTIWRRLLKAGVLFFKGSVYILPHTEENREFFTWLVSEVTSLKGEASYVSVDMMETDDDREIIALFNRQREAAYQSVLSEIEEIERRIISMKMGGDSLDRNKLVKRIRKVQRDFDEIKKIDFFSSQQGIETGARLEKIVKALNGLIGPPSAQHTLTITPVRREDFQNKIWATRKRPFVDRFASAWLIKKFVDKKASFSFIDEKDLNGIGKDMILFDIRGGRFTHAGNLCTFEVLMKSFNIKNKALKKIAEIVHELDMKDDKFRNPEAKGIEDILLGIRKTAKDDYESLEKGIAIFEMLYQSMT